MTSSSICSIVKLGADWVLRVVLCGTKKGVSQIWIISCQKIQQNVSWNLILQEYLTYRLPCLHCSGEMSFLSMQNVIPRWYTSWSLELWRWSETHCTKWTQKLTSGGLNVSTVGSELNANLSCLYVISLIMHIKVIIPQPVWFSLPSGLLCFCLPKAEAREDLGHSNGMTERVFPCGINNLLE